eukprot:TRINITY_DN7673_c1_g1_i1.p1 TRINITY_DN7673_c1_g1~~TRINITY_DN7673_c1_g1_i1.p1  ORF type:complete len:415 (+),score=107.42 TRINITY_DN7673_c1_g1_i1:134-1246(+)
MAVVRAGAAVGASSFFFDVMWWLCAFLLLAAAAVGGAAEADGHTVWEDAGGGVCDQAVQVPTQVAHPYVLGDTKLNITVYTQPGKDGAIRYRFLNLHENENTSVVAAKSLLYQKGGGSIVFLQHGGQRQVSFRYSGASYSFDPNRMFTSEGVRMTLSPYDAAAAALVSDFAVAVLDVYNFTGVSMVIALHNNSPNYSALDYLPGGAFENDAEKVHIGRLFTPRDFFYISDTYVGETLYNCLTAQEFSAVLQANDSVTNDGSLSVYAALHDKPYVNVEAAAEGGATGNAVINQLVLLDHLTTLIVFGAQQSAPAAEGGSDEYVTPPLFLLALAAGLGAALLVALQVVVLMFTRAMKLPTDEASRYHSTGLQ